jgi:prepilin-type N-terminal cleavage/methylation domain-containing protein/prepilin-type processing-associated H-X9-DG protein
VQQRIFWNRGITGGANAVFEQTGAPPRTLTRFPSRRFRTNRQGFSALELLVVIGILVILISIFVPYLLKLREDAHRIRCVENLQRIAFALGEYANRNGGDYPRVIYDPAIRPAGYRQFTGPDSGDPFAKDSAVQPGDVTASLWLLVRLNLAQPADFICPSTDDSPDTLSGPAGRRANFHSPANLSYSYASPFSGALGYRLNSDSLKPDFAVMADRNPGVIPPPANATPLNLSAGNSPNHDRAGQNVLYVDGHVEFQSTPYCGVGVTHDNINYQHDNIFTALTATPLQKGQSPPPDGVGVVSPDVGPAWWGDSYLVPTAADGVTLPIVVPTTTPVVVPPPPPVAPTTRPATTSASRPTTASTTAPTSKPTTRPTSRPTTQ